MTEMKEKGQTVATFQLQRSGRLCFVESGLVAVRCENPAEMHLVRKIRSGKTESRPPHQEGCESKKVLQPTQAIQISAWTSEVMRETRLVDGDSLFVGRCQIFEPRPKTLKFHFSGLPKV